MPIDDHQEWYDIPPTIESYYRDRYACGCSNRNCNLDKDSEKHGTLPGYQGGKCRCDDCKDARRQYNNSRKSLSLPEGDERHGTLNAYYNWNCRCDDCKSARYQEAENKKQNNLPADDNRHGQVATYTTLGCRCYPCKKAYNTWQREYRKRKDLVNASKWYASVDDEDFGLSKREQSEIAGKAIAEHLWEGIDHIFGPQKLMLRLHTVSEFEKRFPDHTIQIDENDEPYVSHKVGDWEGRYFDGGFIELHHKKYGPMDLINLQDRDGEIYKPNQDEFHHEVEHFVKHDAQQYVDNEKRRRSSSKIISENLFSNINNSNKFTHLGTNKDSTHLASPSGTCLSCGTPLSNRMDSYCPTCSEISSQANDMAYQQINPNHPEARPFQKPHDYSGNE